MVFAKKFLFSAFALFLTIQAYQLVVLLITTPVADAVLLRLFLLAFLINIYITGIFAFLGFVFPTHKLIGKNYYKLRNPKLLTKVYDAIGVDLFRKLLLFFFWGRGKNRAKYFNGTRGGLQNFIYQCKQSEFGHLGAFVLILAVSLLLMWNKLVMLAILTTVMNVIGNLYPIILQRHHRIKIEQILK